MLAPGIYQQMQTTCDACGGKGKIVTSTCPHCKARKVVRDVEQIDIAIDRGMRDGEVIVRITSCVSFFTATAHVVEI
jgi:DnaJ-related protein SCJ1